MKSGSFFPQRWRSASVLGIAVAMLLLGLTLLKPYLGGIVYIFYWLGCIVFTFLALIFAFADLRQVRQQSREEQRELIEHAMDGLPAAPRDRPRGSDD
jgi:hypothetical protein